MKNDLQITTLLDEEAEALTEQTLAFVRVVAHIRDETNDRTTAQADLDRATGEIYRAIQTLTKAAQTALDNDLDRGLNHDRAS